MFSRKPYHAWFPILLVCLTSVAASAQSFRVQCPTTTITHPSSLHSNNSEPSYNGATIFGNSSGGFQQPTSRVNGAIKCQQISGGDGFATMGDGTQTYLFAFGPLSGLADMAAGKPGTQFPNVFNQVYSGTPLRPGDPATTLNSGGTFDFNGAVGLMRSLDATIQITSIAKVGGTVIVRTATPHNLAVGDTVTISGVNPLFGANPALFNGTFTISSLPTIPAPQSQNFAYSVPVLPLLAFADASNSLLTLPLDGHVDPRQIMDIGVLNGNMPAPLMAIDEDDEFFLTLTNVGQIMRPDLFEQHTVHFHGYPNASAFYDGVPDASVAINIGGSFTYYYLAPDAGTYFWHCHITPPEHLQMGMVGQIYVRPRQNRVPTGTQLVAALRQQQADARTACRRPGDNATPVVSAPTDILCSNPVPAVTNAQTGGFTNAGAATKMFAYNDGDGSTQYEIEYPIQIHGFDPNFHFVGMTFNPENFTGMKDKYFLLNGRSYPDTVGGAVNGSGKVVPGPLQTITSDGAKHVSQPLPTFIDIPHNGRALLRISDLDTSEHQTLASMGIPMTVIALNARLLRDQAGNNLYYKTNSITLGGGESLDVILDSCTGRDANGSCTQSLPPGTYYLYTPNLDHLSNDAENFGGLMTEVRVN
jgi:FtsP/CotA-like multicopper oxidase with cupredoxin domain